MKVEAVITFSDLTFKMCTSNICVWYIGIQESFNGKLNMTSI